MTTSKPRREKGINSGADKEIVRSLVYLERIATQWKARLRRSQVAAEPQPRAWGGLNVDDTHTAIAA